MATIPLVAKQGNMVNYHDYSGQIQGAGLVAREKIQMGEACYIDTDGVGVYRSYASTDGTTVHDEVRFYALQDFEIGEQFAGIEGPITLGYSDGTISAAGGLNAFLAASSGSSPYVRGRLQTTAVYDGQSPVGYLRNSVKLRVFPAAGRGVYAAP